MTANKTLLIRRVGIKKPYKRKAYREILERQIGDTPRLKSFRSLLKISGDGF